MFISASTRAMVREGRCQPACSVCALRGTAVAIALLTPEGRAELDSFDRLTPETN